jgi:hypothetical protein
MKAAAFLLIACGAISGGCSRDSAPTAPPITAPPTTAPPTTAPATTAPATTAQPTTAPATTAQPPGAPSPGAPSPGAANLIRTPPIKLLNDQQLRALSLRCEKYVPENSARGPYDAAYCEAAMAAWSDAPLQMIPIEKDSIPQPTAAPK